MNKMVKTAWASALIALALGGASVETAAAQSTGASGFTVVYDIHAKGITAGKFTYSVTRAGDAYQASADRKMTGLVRIAVGNKQDYHYAAKGIIAADGVHPQTYYHVGGKHNRRVDVDFTSGDAVTTANPEMGMGNPPATEAQRTGAIDQVSSILAMSLAGGDPCQRTFHVYLDGRSRFDLVMSPDGSERVSNDAFKGVAHKCQVEYKPIAGFSDPQDPATLTFLFGAVGGVYAPIRIAMPTDDAGIVTLEAKSFTLKP